MNKEYLDYLKNSTKVDKLVGMELFLNHIFKLFKDNYDSTKGLSRVNSHIIYSELVRYGLNLKTDYDLNNSSVATLDIKEKGYFNKWAEAFQNVPNIRVYCNEGRYPYFMQFKNGYLEPDEDFTKIYVSLDADHIFEGANRLFTFMSINNIEHASKIGRHLRNDSIVIRIRRQDQKGLRLIKNFIQSDPYIKEGQNKMNPFIPDSNNVAVISDNNESYNGEIAKLMERVALKNISKRSISLSDLLSEINTITNDNIRETLKNHINIELENSKEDILESSVLCTYQQIGYKQASEALKRVIKEGNYKYFTRFKGTDQSINYRNLLSNNIKKEEVADLISDYLQKYGYKVESYSIPDLIELYVLQVTAKYQVLALDETIKYVINNNNSEYAEQVLNDLMHNQVNNNQDLLNTKVNPKYLTSLIKYSLSKQGVDTKYLYPEDIPKTYIDSLKTDVFTR